tara:strand:+ start:164 stop:340 length:177 start_codon:yes stop_codon:yes gene_type:complete
MNLIELLFIIMCVWVLYIAIRFALEEIKDVELELEEVKKQLKQEKEDSKLLAELLINK